jgi:hypothetical protein
MIACLLAQSRCLDSGVVTACASRPNGSVQTHEQCVAAQSVPGSVCGRFCSCLNASLFFCTLGLPSGFNPRPFGVRGRLQ